jgi:alkaline phosphatase
MGTEMNLSCRLHARISTTLVTLLFVGLAPTLLANSRMAAAPLPEAATPRQLAGGISRTGTGAQAIILVIGDGMGEAQRTAARWVSAGREGALAMDAMPAHGWAHTGAADNPVTDSAAAATALATGVKTNNGVIGLDPDGRVLTTILEQARSEGWAVGLVTNVQMAHATPAAFAAHVSQRSMMLEIASQMLDNGVELLLGGGEDEFLPDSATGCYPEAGERTDGRDLTAEAVAAGYTYVCDASGLAAIDPSSTSRLLGLFADEGLSRPHSPTLAEMTDVALKVLSQDPDGFFLMIEGGQIDWAGHANDATNLISDTLDLDQAVAVAQDYALAHDGVLVVVTADHETGGMSVNLAPSGLPGEDGPFLTAEGIPFHVNWTTTSHTAADVPVTAQGPRSQLLASSYENTYIHYAMQTALAPLYTIHLPLSPHAR